MNKLIILAFCVLCGQIQFSWTTPVSSPSVSEGGQVISKKDTKTKYAEIHAVLGNNDDVKIENLPTEIVDMINELAKGEHIPVDRFFFILRIEARAPLLLKKYPNKDELELSCGAIPSGTDLVKLTNKDFSDLDESTKAAKLREIENNLPSYDSTYDNIIVVAEMCQLKGAPIGLLV